MRKRTIVKSGDFYFVIVQSESDSRYYDFDTETPFATTQAAEAFIRVRFFCSEGESQSVKFITLITSTLITR